MAMVYYRAYGFLEVTRGDGGKAAQKFYTVAYGGNMGANMTSVRKCFDAIYGDGAFSKVYPLGVKEYGTPSYSWSIQVPRAAFERTVDITL